MAAGGRFKGLRNTVHAGGRPPASQEERAVERPEGATEHAPSVVSRISEFGQGPVLIRRHRGS